MQRALFGMVAISLLGSALAGMGIPAGGVGGAEAPAQSVAAAQVQQANAETLAAQSVPETSAEQSVAGCLASSTRVSAGQPGGSDPNDLTQGETVQVEKQMTAKLKSKGLTATPQSSKTKVTVDVRVHVITRSDGTGGVSKKQIADQIAVLNAAFGGKSASLDAPTIFQFATKSIDYTKNNDWYQWSWPGTDPADDQEAKAALRKGGSDDLNVYITGLSDGLLGYSSFPTQSAMIKDGVVILNKSLPGGSLASYNRGDTLTHEVGHWFGLYHTFENGCAAPGDSVSDTPSQADGNNIFYCKESDNTCPALGRDPVHNFMSYGDDKCVDRFTAGQSTRMKLMWFAYRVG